MAYNKAGRYIGLCAASRNLVCGTELVLGAVRKGPGYAKLVLLASDASERTAKQVRDKCAAYGVKLLPVPLTMEELSDCAGKKSLVAAAAVTDAGLAQQIIKTL